MSLGRISVVFGLVLVGYFCFFGMGTPQLTDSNVMLAFGVVAFLLATGVALPWKKIGEDLHEWNSAMTASMSDNSWLIGKSVEPPLVRMAKDGSEFVYSSRDMHSYWLLEGKILERGYLVDTQENVVSFKIPKGIETLKLVYHPLYEFLLVDPSAREGHLYIGYEEGTSEVSSILVEFSE